MKTDGDYFSCSRERVFSPAGMRPRIQSRKTRTRFGGEGWREREREEEEEEEGERGWMGRVETDQTDYG